MPQTERSQAGGGTPRWRAARRDGGRRGGRRRGGRLAAAPSRRGRAGRGRRERLFRARRGRAGRDYRSGQRLLFVGGARRPGRAAGAAGRAGRPAPARRALERAGERPVLGGAAAAAGLVVALSVGHAALRRRGARARGRRRPLDPGPRRLARRLGKANGISAAIAAGVGSGPLALIRRFGRPLVDPGQRRAGRSRRRLHVARAGGAGPALQRVREAAAGQGRDRTCSNSASRPDVEIGEVYSVDASRRSTALNAYVGGLGPTKRVVLYDNLLDEARPGRAPLGGRPRARPRGRTGHPARPAVRGDRRAARAAVRLAARRGARAPRGRRARAADLAARAGDRAGGDLVRDRRRRQPALAGGRGEGRHLRAGADRRPAGADRAAAAAGRDQPLRPRPARGWSASCSEPIRRRWSGSGRRWQPCGHGPGRP